MARFFHSTFKGVRDYSNPAEGFNDYELIKRYRFNREEIEFRGELLEGNSCSTFFRSET